MARRGELTDEAGERIAPLLPGNGRRSKQWKDHREVINGILWRIRTGAPWRDLPSRYGPWQTCYDRFARWRRELGTWDRLFAHAQLGSDAADELVWEVSVDSTICRAHQHAAGARRRASREDAKRGSPTRRTKRSGEAGRADDQGASCLRQARSGAVGGRDPGPAPRGHAARGGARCHPGGAPRHRPTTQASRKGDRRPRLRLPELPLIVAAAGHPAHGYPSDATRKSGARGGPGGRRASTPRPTHGATWPRGALTDSSSGAGWRRATRSGRPTTARR